MSLDVPAFPDSMDQKLRQVLEDWFYRFQMLQADVPPGTIVEYAGATPPDGWVECDGTEYDSVKFPELAKVIGVESSPGQFEVPDATLETPVLGQIFIIKV